mmetsp:Transcript_57319/g.166362  ORF Transcript_57319/g.166362 Transcript_57319/m.166362 type:complete len:272 (-) Transcript_57319:915-1730(-)
MRPRISVSLSWQACTDSWRMASRNLRTSSVGCCRCFSSTALQTWSNAFSTASRSGAFAWTSSWSSSSMRLFAARLLCKPCNSSISFLSNSSAFSLAMASAFSLSADASNMCGMTVQHNLRKYSKSTYPCSSGCTIIKMTWICIRERQSWSALKSKSRKSQIGITLSWKPSRRLSKMRCTRRFSTSVSTRALCSASIRNCCNRRLNSSYGTMPKSSSLHICMSICTSILEKRSLRVSRQRRNSLRGNSQRPAASTPANASRAARATSSISSP